MAVAVDQPNGFRPFSQTRRCKIQSFSHLDYKSPEHANIGHEHSCMRLIKIASLPRSSSTPCLTPAKEPNVHPKIEILSTRVTPVLLNAIIDASIAIASGVVPVSARHGVGGAYIIADKRGRNIALVKPIGEDCIAYNFPRLGGLVSGLPHIRQPIQNGETGIREVAAYLLDHDGFAGVPPTALVKITRSPFGYNDVTRVASFHLFVDHKFDAGELGPSGFSVGSVHRVGILDIRTLNLDRHAGNLLVKFNGEVGSMMDLVPIDHGLCLPEWLDDPYFEWMYWPQASVPFSTSEIEYISSLNPLEEAKLLRSELPSLPETSIRVLVLCTTFLKHAVTAGLCLADIGRLMTRERHCGGPIRSILENLCVKAKIHTFNKFNKEKDDGDCTSRLAVDEDGTKAFAGFPDFLFSPPNVSNPSKTSRFFLTNSAPKMREMAPLTSHGEKNVGSTDGASSSDLSHDQGVGSIRLGGMNGEEWGLFLGQFERLLPQALKIAKQKVLAGSAHNR